MMFPIYYGQYWCDCDTFQSLKSPKKRISLAQIHRALICNFRCGTTAAVQFHIFRLSIGRTVSHDPNCVFHLCTDLFLFLNAHNHFPHYYFIRMHLEHFYWQYFHLLNILRSFHPTAIWWHWAKCMTSCRGAAYVTKIKSNNLFHVRRRTAMDGAIVG